MNSLLEAVALDCFRPVGDESAGLRVSAFLDELGKKMLEAWEILRGREMMEVFLELSVSLMVKVCCEGRGDLCPLEKVLLMA